MNTNQSLSTFIIFIFFCVFVYLYYYKEVSSALIHKKTTIHHHQKNLYNGLVDVETLDAALKKANKQPYTVIIWEPIFGVKRSISVSAKKCGWCNFSYNKDDIYKNETRALVFHFEELSFTSLPKKRRDADIFTPYGFLYHSLSRARKSKSNVTDIVSRKTKLAIWIVSNCKFTKFAKTRMEFSNKLIQAGLKLDRKGGCFPPYRRDNNINEIRNYKFYMAFENSYHCKDYITEKVFDNSFQMGAVPVVLGATKSDYQEIMPPGSFIFVEDFKTPKDLVDYLNYLDKNDTAYLQYFKWRSMKIENAKDYQRRTGFCQLCRVLHGINVDNIYNERSEELGSYIPLFGYPNRSRVVPSLRDWFYGTENRECLPSY